MLLHVLASSCPTRAPVSWIPSQDRKTVIMNPVTQHRNGSMGSSTAAKRGYDTESVAWSHSHQPYPLILSVGEWGSGCLTVGENKAPEQLLKPGYGGRVCMSVISVLGMKTSALITCLSCIYLYIYIYRPTETE